jgi:hypothetical protein
VAVMGYLLATAGVAGTAAHVGGPAEPGTGTVDRRPRLTPDSGPDPSGGAAGRRVSTVDHRVADRRRVPAPPTA